MRFKVTLDELKQGIVGQAGYFVGSPNKETFVKVIDVKVYKDVYAVRAAMPEDLARAEVCHNTYVLLFDRETGEPHKNAFEGLYLLDPEDYRICKVTKLPMVEGYLDEDTGETYLNLTALEEEWGSTTVEQMIDDERVFYTEWEETTHYSDDASICGEKRKVWEELFYNFKASVEGATDFDYLKEIADNFCEITDEINSSDKEYVFI